MESTLLQKYLGPTLPKTTESYYSDASSVDLPLVMSCSPESRKRSAFATSQNYWLNTYLRNYSGIYIKNKGYEKTDTQTQSRHTSSGTWWTTQHSTITKYSNTVLMIQFGDPVSKLKEKGLWTISSSMALQLYFFVEPLTSLLKPVKSLTSFPHLGPPWWIHILTCVCVSN